MILRVAGDSPYVPEAGPEEVHHHDVKVVLLPLVVHLGDPIGLS